MLQNYLRHISLVTLWKGQKCILWVIYGWLWLPFKLGAGRDLSAYLSDFSTLRRRCATCLNVSVFWNLQMSFRLTTWSQSNNEVKYGLVLRVRSTSYTVNGVCDTPITETGIKLLFGSKDKGQILWDTLGRQCVTPYHCIVRNRCCEGISFT